MDIEEQKISTFMELYKPVEKQLSAYCRVLTRNEDAARDLLQDTLLAAFEGFRNLRNVEFFIYYLCGIARNKYLKQKRRRKLFEDRIEINKHEFDNSAEYIEMQSDIQLLYKFISKLKTEQREVLEMFHIMGFSIDDIQQKTGLTEAAVKNRLQRAREKLKQMFSESKCYHIDALPLILLMLI